MDVMFYEVFEEEQEALVRFLPKDVKAGFTEHTIQASRAKALPAPLIAIRTQSVIPSGWRTQLAGVFTRSSGFDHLREVMRQVPRGLSCGYLPSYCARAVAEQAAMMLLALLRQLKKQTRQFERFHRSGIVGGECLERRLLVIGVGQIGREMVELGQGLGMQVRGVDLVESVSSVPYVSLGEGIRWAQAIVVCLPLTELTHGMLNYQALKEVEHGAILVNVSRGEITPLRDLERLLQEGILGGVGLDVYEEESSLSEALRRGRGKKKAETQLILSLKDRDNVILTPHNAFNTREALEKKARQSVEALVGFLKDNRFPEPYRC